MKSHFFTTKDGFNLHYQIVENILPTTTVFLHGNIASNRWWIPAQEVFFTESKGKNLTGSMICVEFLGCGKSQAPNSAEDVDMLKYAADFNDLIQHYQFTTSKPDKVNLVGHSTGGFIAAAMTSLKPELFNKAVLLDPVGAKGLVLDENIKAGFAAMAADKTVTAMGIGATIYNNKSDTDYFQKVIVEDAFSALQKISYWVVQAFHGMDASELLQKSVTPTLVLHGEHDVLLSREASEELAVKHLKNAKFEVIPGHGHCMNVENPTNFVQKVSSYLF